MFTQELNLGTVKFGEVYKFHYSVKNDDADVMNITKLVVGCTSCTKAYTNKTLLHPGESTTINVEYTPGSTGVQMKNVTVQYNIGDKSKHIVLKFRAIVEK